MRGFNQNENVIVTDNMMRVNIGPNLNYSSANASASASGYSNVARCILKCDQIILKNIDLAEQLADNNTKIQQIVEKVDILENKIDNMITMLREMYYAPNMPGFVVAQQNFDDLKLV